MKKKVIKSAIIYFLMGAAVNGRVYKLINYEKYSDIMKHLIVIAIMIFLALLFSYIGYKFQQKKTNDKKTNITKTQIKKLYHDSNNSIFRAYSNVFHTKCNTVI
ncbi:hypothetical protein [Flavobacterium tegetincola]|uniref:hypothetical protein n=1 Tax=Flavobacterium tegetincola TaxID=150172 RepID=UPI00047EFD95|nr:hypothetical protein [Flavobacterium tegetincola]